MKLRKYKTVTKGSNENVNRDNEAGAAILAMVQRRVQQEEELGRASTSKGAHPVETFIFNPVNPV